MTESEDQRREPAPSEGQGGAPTADQEAQDKGEWAATSKQGVVPAELGGSDAPAELQSEDPELGSEVTGGASASDEPATEAGIDAAAGDSADATTQGGAADPDHAEPDLKDAASGPRQSDVDAST